MLASILRSWKQERSLSTKGNLNNDIGVPLTILGLRATHEAAVIELGMNHPGEIEYLAKIAKPTIALVNNAQREHLEFMQNVNAVAQENGNVITSLPAHGIAVFPANDSFTGLWRSLAAQRKILTFALEGPADVTARSSWQGEAWSIEAATPFGSISFRLKVAGKHNVKNALAAISCALAAEVPIHVIAKGLENFESVKGRSRVIILSGSNHKTVLIDDTYNANPDSVRAAIDMLAELPGPHLLVLGDMGEVGDQGPEFHAEVGEYAAECGIEHLLCSGDLMRYCAAAFPGARHIGGADSLVDAVVGQAPFYRSILVKGSRFMRMERVVTALLASADEMTQEISNAN
jgi:UDP-N-acetylmuramoyl-tripeptide--D-alanyl-D-alanine ligase